MVIGPSRDDMGQSSSGGQIWSLPDTLADDVVRLYQHIASVPASDTDSAAAALRWPIAIVSEHFEHLLAFGLIRPTAPGSRQFTSVTPEAAAACILGGAQSHVTEAQQQIDRVRSNLLALDEVYREAQRTWKAPSEISVVEGLETVRSLLADLSRTCENELLSLQPGSGASAEALEQAGRLTMETLARGVRQRVIFHHTARAHLPTVSHVREISQAGAEVRSVADLPDRMLIIDGKMAVVPVAWRASRAGATIVRDPAVVSFMAATFETLWTAGTPFEVADNVPQAVIPDDLRQTIVQLLANGYKDEAIAHRMGVSVRTCRRHIADLMNDISASSRFQAGFLTAQSGGFSSPTG
ncbi:regulatory LuxR family protein [Streptomyces sp. 846.5]|nr:LuxR family transcriptional regulator [Streptomyces sp. 846.5]TDU04472.1 regulatory LuxR family protein [Streptomyces sp. 846.5]